MASIDVDTNAVIEELLDRIKRLTLENVVLTKALESFEEGALSTDNGA